jgi:hypothetical protein
VPSKLYETVIDFSRREEMRRIAEERGIRTWWTPDPDEPEEARIEREAFLGRMTAAAGPVTTRVDVGDHLDAKYAAMREHVTQLAPDFLFLALTPDDWRKLQPTEDFTLRVSRVGVRIPEDDLFAGLPDEDSAGEPEDRRQ